MVRVLLCDDAVAFGILFGAWMEDADDIELVAHAHSAGEAVELAAEHQPDVVVLDHLLHGATSGEVAPRLRAAAPGVRVVVLSGMPQGALEEAARAAGADGYVSKAATAEQIRAAVLAAAG